MEILIKTTNACNLSCTHCLDAANKNGKAILYPFELLETWLPKHANVAFFGGEPLLGDLDAMYQLTKKRQDCFWRITTNLVKPLTVLDIAVLRQMDIITTSFDIGVRFGSIKQLLTWMRNVKRIAKYTTATRRLNICMTKELLAKPNIEKKLLRLLEMLYFDEVFFSKIIDNGEDASNHQPSSQRQEEFMEMFYKLSKHSIVNCCVENIINTQYIEEYKDTPDCSSTSLTIHPSGNITTCSQFCEYNGFANIITDTYEETFNKRKLCRVHATCLTCEFFDVCEKSCWKEDWSKGCPYYKQFAHKIRTQEL